MACECLLSSQSWSDYFTEVWSLKEEISPTRISVFFLSLQNSLLETKSSFVISSLNILTSYNAKLFLLPLLSTVCVSRSIRLLKSSSLSFCCSCRSLKLSGSSKTLSSLLRKAFSSSVQALNSSNCLSFSSRRYLINSWSEADITWLRMLSCKVYIDLTTSPTEIVCRQLIQERSSSALVSSNLLSL